MGKIQSFFKGVKASEEYSMRAKGFISFKRIALHSFCKLHMSNMNHKRKPLQIFEGCKTMRIFSNRIEYPFTLIYGDLNKYQFSNTERLNDQRWQRAIICRNKSSFKQKGSDRNVFMASLPKKYKDFRRNVKLTNLRKMAISYVLATPIGQLISKLNQQISQLG